MCILKKILFFVIKFYQQCISPYIKSQCRFYPTCSQYAILAIEKYPVHIAFYKILKRICKCHPFYNKDHIDMP